MRSSKPLLEAFASSLPGAWPERSRRIDDDSPAIIKGMQTADAMATSQPKTPASLKRAFFWGAAVTVIGLDQLTKGLVRTFLDRGESWPDGDAPIHIHYVTNTGAAFGILEDQTVFLT